MARVCVRLGRKKQEAERKRIRRSGTDQGFSRRRDTAHARKLAESGPNHNGADESAVVAEVHGTALEDLAVTLVDAHE